MDNQEIEEAIEQLTDSLDPEYLESDGEWTTYSFNTSAIRSAIEALKKNIPQKPKKAQQFTMCPACYEKYGFDYDILVGTKGLKTGKCYCLNCGQVIDLEVKNETGINRRTTN
jgi:transcription initiation factor IIE alpha subunit